MDFTDAQIAELIEVFRTESIEHVKGMAEVFLKMDEDTGGDFKTFLSTAFREAHSLKGSAGTLGFTRVEILSARMEDVLGILARGELPTTPDIIYTLLSALDAIRIAVGEAEPGEDRLTEEEARQQVALEKLIEASGSAVPDQISSMPPISDEPGISALADEQLAQLVGVFQAESREHIRALTETIFKLEERVGDRSELLTGAFREAHSLKGSAGTLGFRRVERLTHRLEDVLGQLRIPGGKLHSRDIDLLLQALDAIHRAVQNSDMEEDRLTEDEMDLARALKLRVNQLAEEQLVAVSSHPPAVIVATDIAPAPDPAVGVGPAPEAFIRVAESKVESVIVQVGELFEANLKLEAMVSEFERLCEVAEETVDSLELMRIDMERTPYDVQFGALSDRIRNLSFQLRSAVTGFDREERQVAKLAQTSQEELHKIRLAPVSTIFVMIRQQVREMSRKTGKPLELFLSGGEYAVDRKVLEAIEEPIVHILRNAADHGIENPHGRQQAGKERTGRLGITVRHTGDAVELTVSDDGQGIDPEKVSRSLVEKKLISESQVANLTSDQILDYLFESGFSTQREVSEISGRGVGLDVVKYTVERLGGEVRLDSRKGKGTAITMRLPLVMSTIRCLLIQVSGKVFAIPAANVERVLIPKPEMLKVMGGGDVLVYRDRNIPLGSLNDILCLTADMSARANDQRIVVIVSFGDRYFAFVIDELIEYTQAILKPLGDLLERVPNISGISLLGTGQVALVLNPADLVRAAGVGSRTKTPDSLFPGPAPVAQERRVLVVDDSIATRTLEKTLLESAGFTVLTASDGYKALDILTSEDCDVVISDIQMPNMDGIELTRTIRNRRPLEHLPVILITSLGSDEDKARGLAAGADAYIVKRELTQRELVETINQLL
jgi:two-component system chemotaxis sensor kinase CheA